MLIVVNELIDFILATLEGDYCHLNEVTISDKYSTAKLQGFAQKIHGWKVFIIIDLISVVPEDGTKTNAIWFGFFESQVMTFALCNGIQNFQVFIDNALRGFQFSFVNINDIVIVLA